MLKAQLNLDVCLVHTDLPRAIANHSLATLTAHLRQQHEAALRREQPAARPRLLLEWGRTFLPSHFTLPPSGMHRWLAQALDDLHACRGAKINVVGPRGAAKSTLGTLAYPLREALEGREPYIWIVSDTRHQARAQLDNIKAELLDNELLHAAYPQATGPGTRWRAGQIVLRSGVCLEAYGTGQRMRGRRRREHRPTLIVCDDLQNDGHTQSALQREHSRQWFQAALLKAGTKRTNIVNLATALHREALAMELHRTPGWTSRTFRAIESWPHDMRLWEAWQALYAASGDPQARQTARDFYERQREAMHAGAVLLWPEEEDLYTLMCLRAEGGRVAFEREKQSSPINPELCEWPESYFDASLQFDDWPTGLVVRTMALDPSKGRDARWGDYSAYVLLGIDRGGTLYVEADLARRPTPQMVADGVALVARFRPAAFGVEANQFQDLLADDFEQAFRQQQLLGVRPWLLENRVNKLVRIRRLSPYLASRRLRFKAGSPSTQMLINQLKDFPIGDHDDGPDALEMAIRLADELLSNAASGDGLGNRLPIGARG